MIGNKVNLRNSMLATIAVGLGLALLVEAAGAMLCAFLINKEVIPLESVGVLAAAVHGISTAIGGVVAGVRTQGKIAIVCAVQGLTLAAIWTGAGILFFDGAGVQMARNMAGICAGCLIACGLLLVPRRTGFQKFTGYTR